MYKIIKDASVWIGTLQEFHKLRGCAYSYDIYIVITDVGTRILQKCRF